MTDNHPITPPPEMVEQWHNEAMLKGFRNKGSYYGHELAIQAARWGADQELEACCEWLQGNDPYEQDYHQLLRAARRPKPPSLKERALQAWAAVEAGTDDQTAMAVIRRALEALPE